MNKDKRKSPRRPIRYTAWIELGPDELHGCVLSDISEHGARIDIDETKPIPDNFTLMLSSNGSARRKCKVVWRKPRNIGVTFERGLVSGENASLVPKGNADAKAVPAPSNAEPAKTA